MAFEDITTEEMAWLDGSGPAGEIVVSSRVRLARNLQGRRFTHHASEGELLAIQQEVTNRVLNRPFFRGGGNIHTAAKSLGPLFYDVQAMIAGRGVLHGYQIKAPAVIPDRHLHRFTGIRQLHGHFTGRGMPSDVGQCLLDDAQ